MPDRPAAVTAVEVIAIISILVVYALLAGVLQQHALLILASIPLTLATVLTFLRSIRTEAAAAAAKAQAEQAVGEVKELKVVVDGRLSQLLEQTAIAARAEGRDTQRAEHESAQAVVAPEAEPTIHQVEVINTPENPVPIKPAIDEK